jgi:hypothetical protein
VREAAAKPPGTSRYFLVLIVLWMVAMTWRLYPQFGDAIRIDGRLTTVADYVADACSQRVGPAAATCLAESTAEAELQLSREQGKSVLLVLAPLLVYFAVWGPLRLLQALRKADG